jgi:hypothetical protein
MTFSASALKPAIHAVVIFATSGLLAACGPPQPVDSDCADAPNCGQCASMGNAGGSCGWCIDAQGARCLPGSSGAAPQSCAGQWIWTPDECSGAAASAEVESAGDEAPADEATPTADPTADDPAAGDSTASDSTDEAPANQPLGPLD